MKKSYIRRYKKLDKLYEKFNESTGEEKQYWLKQIKYFIRYEKDDEIASRHDEREERQNGRFQITVLKKDNGICSHIYKET